MKTAHKLAGAGLVAAAAGFAVVAHLTTASTCFVDQAGVTQPLHLQQVGHTYGIGPMHGVGIIGADGVLYEIISECINNTEDRPQRPGPNAGALAWAWWDFFWTDAEADLHRCNVAFPAGRDMAPPPPRPAAGWPACHGGAIGCVPHHPRAAGSFNPALFACPGSTPPPTPIPVPTPPLEDRPLAAWDEQLAREGVTAGCGAGRFCPDAPLTREQAAVWILKHEHGSDYVPPPCEGAFVDAPCGH